MSYKEALAAFKAPLVMAFGNALLDIIIQHDKYNLCEIYKLPIDEQTELAENEIQEILDTVDQEDLQNQSAGGSALNTLRLFQTLCGTKEGPKLAIFFGGIGLDRRGTTLTQLIKQANIDAKFTIEFDTKSGVCIAILNGPNRALAANIGAAAYYTVEDFNCAIVPYDTVRICYIEGFFITHSFDVAKEVVNRVQGKPIIVVFNLSGTYIFKNHHLQICQMVGMSKIVFGNVNEMIELAKAIPIEFDDPLQIPFHLNKLKSVSISAANSTSNDWLQSPVIVMTQGGSKPAIIVWGKGESALVPPIDPGFPVVDTTGAGDALVAGFFVGVLSGQGPKTCLEWGCKAASQVITRLGVSLPDNLPDDFLEQT